MNVLISIGTGVFVLLCALLVVIILLQSDKSAGMGILGGSSQSAFGSSTADIITKITTVMVALFMILSLGLSILESVRDKAIERELVPDKKVSGTIDKDQKEPAAKKDVGVPKGPAAQSTQPNQPNQPVQPKSTK